MEVITIAVEELDGALLEVRAGPLLTGLEDRSTVCPRLMLRSLMRTWAEPRPILMWW